jgi:glyoxylase-like metal-dependent hydrolase (beta-lactamase superfamily II)
VLVRGFPAGSFGTNCYVVAVGEGEQCLVVDPGQDAVGQLDEVIARHRLHPAAVLLTHGHLDHTWSVAPVCGARDIPAYIHPDDRAMLSDPGATLGSQLGRMIAGMEFTEPDDVRELGAEGGLDLAGIGLEVQFAPGHTPGSITFGTTGGGPDDEPILFSGDFLFAGSIGRCDLPGGSYPEMLRSLARVILPMADETLVLSGHGPATTIGRERAANPYLAEAINTVGAPGPAPKGRGL